MARAETETAAGKSQPVCAEEWSSGRDPADIDFHLQRRRCQVFGRLERKVQQKQLELVGSLRSRNAESSAKTALDDLYAELSAIEPQIVYEREAILRLQKDIAMRDEVLVVWEERQRARQRKDFHVEEDRP